MKMKPIIIFILIGFTIGCAGGKTYIQYAPDVNVHSEHPTKCLDNGKMLIIGHETELAGKSIFKLDAGGRGRVVQFEESDRDLASMPREDTRTKESWATDIYLKPKLDLDIIEFFLIGGTGLDYMPNNSVKPVYLYGAGVGLNITDRLQFSVMEQDIIRSDGGHYKGAISFGLQWKF